jgi:hypothetical protein
MIKNLIKTKEITVPVKNEVGALARMMSFLVNHGINVEAMTGSADHLGEEGKLIFITDNNEDAIDVLQSEGYQAKENDVVIIEVENRPGTLKNVSEVLALNKININYFYCTTCSGGCPAKMVLATSDNNKAFRLFCSSQNK